VVIGASAAALKGGSNNLVSLGSNPISLLYDGADPSLYVSQGVLSLNGNAFAINTASGSALPPGAYPVILQATGNISSLGVFPAVGGNAIGAGQTGSMVVSNNIVSLVVAAAPTISLNIPVVRGDGTVQLTFSGVNPSLSYRVQVNDDLTTTNWTTLYTSVAGARSLPLVIDAGATNNARRFYRIVMP
jgi:hypothetical protein